MVSAKLLLLVGSSVVILVTTFSLFMTMGGTADDAFAAMFKKYYVSATLSEEGGYTTTLKIYVDQDANILQAEMTKSDENGVPDAAMVLDGNQVSSFNVIDGVWNADMCAVMESALPDFYENIVESNEDRINAASIILANNPDFEIEDGVDESVLNTPIFDPSLLDADIPLILWVEGNELEIFYKYQKFVVEFTDPNEEAVDDDSASLMYPSAIRWPLAYEDIEEGGAESDRFIIDDFAHGSAASGMQWTSGVGAAHAAVDPSSCTAPARRLRTQTFETKEDLEQRAEEFIHHRGLISAEDAKYLKIIQFADATYYPLAEDSTSTAPALISPYNIFETQEVANSRTIGISGDGHCHIAIAGSDDNEDWMQNINVLWADMPYPEDFPEDSKGWSVDGYEEGVKQKIKVHSGFKEHLLTAVGSGGSAKTGISAIMANPKCTGDIHFYGHSLGAATASLAGMYYSRNSRVKSINLVAPPRAFRPAKRAATKRVCVSHRWWGWCNKYETVKDSSRWEDDHDFSFYDTPVTSLNNFGDPVVQLPPGYMHVKSTKRTCGLEYSDGRPCKKCSNSYDDFFKKLNIWWSLWNTVKNIVVGDENPAFYEVHYTDSYATNFEHHC